MVRDDLNILSAFLAVAEQKSFTRAAKRMGVSPSAMSHAIRGLEEGIGVRLLSRTTRSVAPTEAGEQLLARLRPALADIQGALDQNIRSNWRTSTSRASNTSTRTSTTSVRRSTTTPAPAIPTAATAGAGLGGRTTPL